VPDTAFGEALEAVRPNRALVSARGCVDSDVTVVLSWTTPGEPRGAHSNTLRCGQDQADRRHHVVSPSQSPGQHRVSADRDRVRLWARTGDVTCFRPSLARSRSPVTRRTLGPDSALGEHSGRFDQTGRWFRRGTCVDPDVAPFCLRTTSWQTSVFSLQPRRKSPPDPRTRSRGRWTRRLPNDRKALVAPNPASGDRQQRRPRIRP